MGEGFLKILTLESGDMLPCREVVELRGHFFRFRPRADHARRDVVVELPRGIFDTLSNCRMDSLKIDVS